MHIDVNTDANIQGGDELTANVEEVIKTRLGRFHERLTHIGVHLTDENSKAKSDANDMRCLLEARLAGLQPIAVSDNGATWSQALTGAVRKLETVLNRSLGRLDNTKGQTSFAGDQSV